LPKQLDSSNSAAGGSNSRVDANFSLYLGDFDWDNFVVDPTNFRVTIVQARHIIATIRGGQVCTVFVFKKIRNRDEMHTVNASVLNEATAAAIATGLCRGNVSETGDAGGPTPPCLSEAHANALCRQPVSDHNYWAICMSILHGGDSPHHRGCKNFLADLPALLRFALEKCLADDTAGARMAHVQAALENIGLALGEA
uniref:Protein kinase domain-containing protein n=1 Tax=Schistocephalus solidus TaxID=70667 RepID=A0A183SIV1_SCHSO